MESRTFKYEGQRNDHTLYYELLFGNVFERKESKCCAVLMKYHRKVEGEQVITLQMAQQLKTKSINAVTGQLSCCQCKAKFLLETDSLVSLHASMKTLKSNISKAFKVQGDCLKDLESDSYDKIDIKEKVNDLVRLHEAMQ